MGRKENPQKLTQLSSRSPTYFCISELVCLCCVEFLKDLPVHSFNALIIPILTDI